MRSVFLLLAIIVSADALAWESRCRTDNFTDTTNCSLITSSGKYRLDLSFLDDDRRLVIAFVDLNQTLYTSRMQFRVDERDVVDFNETGAIIDSDRRGMVIVMLTTVITDDLLNDLKEGARLRVRVFPFRASQRTIEFNLSGFNDAYAAHVETR